MYDSNSNNKDHMVTLAMVLDSGILSFFYKTHEAIIVCVANKKFVPLKNIGHLYKII
jgi:hypothetical protein